MNIKVYETPPKLTSQMKLLCRPGVLLHSTLRLITDYYDLKGMWPHPQEKDNRKTETIYQKD